MVMIRLRNARSGMITLQAKFKRPVMCYTYLLSGDGQTVGLQEKRRATQDEDRCRCRHNVKANIIAIAV